MSKLLDFIHKGKNIIQYKRSYKHPLLNKKYFSPEIGYFTITKIWNVKIKDDICWSNYEKDSSINWEWKVEYVTKTGRYISKLSDLFVMGFEENGKAVSSDNAFIFYK